MTSDALPEPLTPPDCDLRGMDWMPLHGNRLSGSDFEALATDAAEKALAGLARNAKGWLKVKEGGR